MTGTHPESSTGLSQAQLRLVLLVVIGVILVVAGTVRGQTEQSPWTTETAKASTTASDDRVPPRAVGTPMTCDVQHCPGGDAPSGHARHE